MGTSNLYAYEVQDSGWDEFEKNGDHIVPYRIGEAGNLYSGKSDSCKKPWDGGAAVTSNAYSTGKHFMQRKENSRFANEAGRDRRLEKSTWSCTLDGNLHPPCNDDTSKEVQSLQPNDIMMVDSATEFCSDGGMLDEACAALGNNIYDYPYPQLDDQDGFFCNENGGKDNSDLLHFGWPDIGNLEEIDHMFRSCDSTFGLGSLTNEDELYSFLSSHNNEESDGGIKLGFNVLNCESSGQKGGISKGDTASRPSKTGTSISNSELKNSAMSCSTICQTDKVEVTSNEETSLHKKRQYENMSRGEDGYFENSGYLHPGYNPDDFVNARHLSGNSSCLAYSSSSIEQYEHNGEPLPASKQNNAAHQHSSCCLHPADQVSVVTTNYSGLGENSGNPFAKESSYSSNRMVSVNSGQGLPFSSPRSENQYIETLYCQEDLHASSSGNYKCADFANDGTYNHENCNQKQPHKVANEVEGHSGIKGISTDAQDSSFTNSVPDETSLEAKSFRQLQQVTEKLDIKTKLCIRDGLYRLARSAEKRHGCDNLISNFRQDTEVNSALATEEMNKCTGLMDMETDTNPIDRSIAQLLFHGPSDSSTMAGGGDAFSLKSSPLIPPNSTIMPEKQKVSVGETSCDADNEFVDELLH